ncbi:hypothetical protein [endosymbiont of Ridgeia piscesae]|jgi:hypothetical protein|uniref:hypothetical protein n=1 Tax=endosymbiont of Ridgeia piscesae TaxID=54398 RepID=UPI001E55F679|nr:hypothetical protein [endosymbiont of Ridgeia piscesae]
MLDLETGQIHEIEEIGQNATDDPATVTDGHDDVRAKAAGAKPFRKPATQAVTLMPGNQFAGFSQLNAQQ